MRFELRDARAHCGVRYVQCLSRLRETPKLYDPGKSFHRNEPIHLFYSLFVNSYFIYTLFICLLQKLKVSVSVIKTRTALLQTSV